MCNDVPVGNIAHTKQRDNMNTNEARRPLTPAQLEQRLKRAFDQVRPAYLARTAPMHKMPQAIQARRAYDAFRAEHGLGPGAPLLSEDIGKTMKNDTRTYALAFLPHTVSGLANVCAFEDKCAATCVAFSGKGDFKSVRDARWLRLAFAIENPRAFAWLLTAELRKIHTDAVDQNWNTAIALDCQVPPAGAVTARLVRLNAYSDIRWERVCGWLLEDCNAVGFYDYTKHTTRSRPATGLPHNYRLTYSVSPRSKAADVRDNLEQGRNVAVVFPARAHSRNNALPSTWLGFDVIDGDETDDRYSDPRWVVVGLRRKGTLRADDALASVAARIQADSPPQLSRAHFGAFVVLRSAFHNTTLAGHYVGIDDSNGTPYHFFIGGRVGTTRQNGLHGFPVSQTANYVVEEVTR